MLALPQLAPADGPILIVEDDHFIALELVNALRASGAQTTGPVADIETADRLLDTQRVGLAVLDIKLGADMVFPLASRLMRRSVPIIFASGYPPDVIPLEFSGVPVIEKPYSAADVARALLKGPEATRHPTTFRNGLLSRLPHDVLRELRRNASVAPLRQGAVLQRCGAPADHVWFVESGLCTLSLRNCGVEVGMVGREGAAGLDTCIGMQGRPNAHFQCSVAVAGIAVRVAAGAVRDIVSRSAAARDAILAAICDLHAQTARTLEATATMSIVARVARWLAMAHERVGPDIPVTHDILSLYLGVRRAGVTEALQELEASRRIERRRGRVLVRDPAGLSTVLRSNGHTAASAGVQLRQSPPA